MNDKFKISQTENAEFFMKVLLDEIDDAILFVDAQGYISAISYAYTEFLGITREMAIGKHVTDVIENTRMDVVLKTGKAEIACSHKIGKNKMIASRIPIIVDGEIRGAFGRVLFKDMADLDSLYKRMGKLETSLNFYKSNFDKTNSAKYGVDDIIGQSPAIVKVKDIIRRVALGNSNVLILGESGTGKELAAHAIHEEKWGKAESAKRPFVCVNCAAIPSELMESEFFGYEGGAFTGAKGGGKIGFFQAANGGTLFLDEIGELPIHMQVKLLRVLQERKVQKIGAVTSDNIEIRLVSATNRDLKEMMENNLFRDDLYYRLNVISFEMPPLRKRKEDIPALAQTLLQKVSANSNIKIKGFSKSAIEYMKENEWKGNVRELQNSIERAVNFVGDSGIIEAIHLHGNNSHPLQQTLESAKSLKEALDETEHAMILNALYRSNGRKNEAAKALGIGRTSLYEKMKKYNIMDKD